jgi:hypothetical protein
VGPARPNPTKGDLVGNGVKVVGEAPVRRREQRIHPQPDGDAGGRPEDVDVEQAAGPPTATEPGLRPKPRRRSVGSIVLAIVAVVGVAGTIAFGLKWSSLNGRNAAEAQVRQSASTFLVALTNFDAKSVDSDFSRITGMATGTFAGQANEFFNSSIRTELETALASSRGQVRNLYIQSISGNQASVYAVVDQLYVNRSLSAPQSDVLRVVVQMTEGSGTWKVSDVTVLEGPSLTSPSPTSSGTGS